MCETDAVNVFQTLSCLVQLLLHLSERGGEGSKSRTSCSLLTAFFLM